MDCFFLLVGRAQAHRFHSLDQLKEEITSHFTDLLTSANDKVTDICKRDKKMWRILDDEEVECKHMIETIEHIRDEQVS